MTFRKYKTIQGDTFDAISLDFYGDEIYASVIIQANLQYASTLIFDAGVELSIPVLEESVAAALPPWRAT